MFGFVSVVIISRVLTPEEVGIYSISAVIILITTSFRGFGAEPYIVSRDELTTESLKKVTGVVVITSGSLFILLMAGAPAVARFYDEPALTDLLRISAIGYLLVPFIGIPYACLTRKMALDKVACIDVASALVGVITTISLVLLGFGYLSMAIGLTLATLARFVIVNHYRTSDIPWIPQFRGIKDVISFGIFSTTGSAANTASEGLGDLIIGKVGSMADVGIFSRAMGLVALFNRAVTKAVIKVVFPHFSKEYRESGSIASAYCRVVEYQIGLAWPFFAVLRRSKHHFSPFGTFSIRRPMGPFRPYRNHLIDLGSTVCALLLLNQGLNRRWQNKDFSNKRTLYLGESIHMRACWCAIWLGRGRLGTRG